METSTPRGFWALRDLPVAIWLVLLIVGALLHDLLPLPRWLLIHQLLLGAATHAIFVWSQFSPMRCCVTRPRPLVEEIKTGASCCWLSGP